MSSSAGASGSGSGRGVLDLGLARIAAVLAALGGPETAFAAVHVAGTNGKGSVCALVEAVLLSVPRLCVGKFVSPFLVTPRDAVSIDGAPLSEARWASALAAVGAASARAGGDSLTTFELWTAAAFVAFREARVDVAVVEVGVGGGGDATNVLPPPALALLASVALDHTELLGATLGAIAAHKAGIIKRGGGPAVMCPGMAPEAAAVMRARAAALGATLVEAEALEWLEPGAHAAHSSGAGAARQPSTGLVVRVALAGAFQLQNTALALAGLQALRRSGGLAAAAGITDAVICAGFAAVRWRGRMQRVQLGVGAAALDVVVDGGHNEAALVEVRRALDDALRSGEAPQQPRRLIFVYACTASRDLAANLRLLLRPGDAVLAVPFATPEGMPWIRHFSQADVVAAAQPLVAQPPSAPGRGEDVPGSAAAPGAVRACASLGEALSLLVGECQACEARGQPRPLIAVCGSLYLVSEVFRSCTVVE